LKICLIYSVWVSFTEIILCLFIQLSEVSFEIKIETSSIFMIINIISIINKFRKNITKNIVRNQIKKRNFWDLCFIVNKKILLQNIVNDCQYTFNDKTNEYETLKKYISFTMY
jgi:hypothetical protein